MNERGNWRGCWESQRINNTDLAEMAARQRDRRDGSCSHLLFVVHQLFGEELPAVTGAFDGEDRGEERERASVDDGGEMTDRTDAGMWVDGIGRDRGVGELIQEGGRDSRS